MVPINIRLTAHEISDELRLIGATNIERLERGADVDEFENSLVMRPRRSYGELEFTASFFLNRRITTYVWNKLHFGEMPQSSH